MASVNKVILVGNLGRDPEIRTTQSGSRIASLTVATGESWQDKHTGEKVERTEWHRVVIYNDKLVTIAEKYLRKGSKLYLEGKLRTRKWTDQQGIERYTTEIVMQFQCTLVMLSSKNETEGPSQTQKPSQPPSQPQKSYQSATSMSDMAGDDWNGDDDVPF